MINELVVREMKKILSTILVCIIMLICISGCGKEKHIYDTAESVNVMNDTGTEKIAEFGLIKADESDCTEDAIADCYYNYFKTGEYDYCVIVFNDSDPVEGVFMSDAVVEKGALLTEKGDNVYSLSGNAEDVVFYFPAEDGKTLSKIEN